MRARINDRLSRATRFPVTLIVAPAGFGKSVALRDFVETTRLEAVRYDVPRDATTLLSFARGLTVALQPVARSMAASFPAVQERILVAADPVREIADWIDEHLKRTLCTIVIDDLHNAAADAASIALVAELIERTHTRVTWIIAARSDVGLPVASWIGYGRMDVPIGEDELRFTADEALAAAGETDDVVDPLEVEALRELTAGWPIALAIALRMRVHSSDLLSAASGTREMVYRYLAEQVFAGLTWREQRFLLDTSVFATLNAEIASAYGYSGEGFTELRRRIAFLTPASATEYRYHDLFRDFLEHELRRRGAAEWFDVLTRAGELLEGRNDAAALSVFVRAGNVEGIVRIVERDGFVLFERGEREVLSAALDAIPDRLRSEHARLLGLRAMVEAGRGNFEVAESGFTAAIARADDAEVRTVLVHRYAIELVRHERDSTSLLEPYALDDAVPMTVRAPILGTLATAYVRAGRIDEAIAVIQRALDHVDSVGDVVAARLYQQAAFVHSVGGAADRTRAYALLAVEIALANGLYEVAARAYSALYTVVYDESDDPIAILAVLDKLLDAARKGASRQARAYGVIASYEMEVERGDDAAIERLDRELEDLRTGAVSLLRNETLLPAEAMRAGWNGAFHHGYQLLAGSADVAGTSERRALRWSEIAFYAAAAGDAEDADAALREARDALKGGTTPSRRAVRSHLFVALAELVRGHTAAAHHHLTDAERMLTHGMRRLRAFANAVRAYYRVAIGQADAPAVAAALERLRAEHFGGMARLMSALPIGPDRSSAYAQLTPSEREILQLLARGASTKDVAARTGRSPQTVDTHIRSICRKLRCSGRREAIAVAVGSGWIEV